MRRRWWRTDGWKWVLTSIVALLLVFAPVYMPLLGMEP